MGVWKRPIKMKTSLAVPLLLSLVGVGGKSFVGLVPGVPQYYHHQVAPQYYYYPVTRQEKPHPCVGIFAALGCIFQTGGTVAHAGEEIFGGIANGTAAIISGGADGVGAGVGGAAEGVGVVL